MKISGKFLVNLLTTLVAATVYAITSVSAAANQYPAAQINCSKSGEDFKCTSDDKTFFNFFYVSAWYGTCKGGITYPFYLGWAYNGNYDTWNLYTEYAYQNSDCRVELNSKGGIYANLLDHNWRWVEGRKEFECYGANNCPFTAIPQTAVIKKA